MSKKFLDNAFKGDKSFVLIDPHRAFLLSLRLFERDPYKGRWSTKEKSVINSELMKHEL